jgi:glycosyltransferase involved in cell wall biosynthesis
MALQVLLYSKVFPPSVGGVETIALTLAAQLAKLGHDCVVVTETLHNACKSEEAYPFRLYRAPSAQKRYQLAKKCSLIHSNGASLAMVPYARVTNKPFMWTHNGYQVQCLDGLGWDDHRAAPLTPIASIRFHCNTHGVLTAARGSAKLAIRRWVAHCFALNVACTNWVAQRLALPRQVVAYTPYDLSRFRNSSVDEAPVFDFIFVGRLVSEKGILDLLDAFALHRTDPRFARSTLAIVGDGPMRNQVEKSIAVHRLTSSVSLLGCRTGESLIKSMRLGRIGIVPSRWEEPMGGVALELLASERMLIVSKFGGHAECVGDVALTFPNGDVQAMCNCMGKALTDVDFAVRHRTLTPKVLERFDEARLTARYVELYESALADS